MTGLPLRIALLHFLCLLFLTGLAGCGRKGPVQPRLAALPDAPTDVQIAQQGDDFLVSWTLPARNQDGAPAEDLAGFHIYRLIYNAAEGCPTCRDPEELVEAIELRRPEPAARLGKRLYWRDAAIAPGTGHAYLIAPVTVGGLEGATASLHRAWQLPPPPPSALQAEAGDHQVRLSWTPPAALPPGQQLLGYNLYRRPAAGTFPPIALNAEPLREAQLTDFSGEVGQEIIYRVTTVVESAGQQLESVPSPDAAVTLRGAR